MSASLSLYRHLARVRWPKTYLGKFLVTAFIGVHLPLIALVTYVSLSMKSWHEAIPFVIVALVATLGGTIATQIVQKKLLAPLLETSIALDEYVRHRTIPSLPSTFRDEAGLLMSNAQSCITHLDDLLLMKNNLLGVLSHDTRSPTTTINLASSFCLTMLDQEQPNLEEIRFMTNKIRNAAEQQLKMMNSILALARSESQQIRAEQQITTVKDLVNSVADGVQMQAKQKEVQLRVNSTLSDEYQLPLDVVKTEQVLNNLLLNAIKFTPSGGTVKLSARETGEGIEFAVSDTGIGMDEQLQRQLFKPFSSAQRSGTAQEKGTGLGLWICRTFIQAQGGTIDVESAPGKGTTFIVRLPKRSRHTDTAMAAQHAHEGATNGVYSAA